MTEAVPDLLAHLRFPRDHAAVRRRLDSVGRELSTGLRADPAAAAGGDQRRLFHLETERTRAAAAGEAVALARARAEATQAALGRLAGLADGAGVALLAAVGRGDLATARAEAGRARSDFAAAVDALNARHGGRSLFAGAAADRPALAEAGAILADVLAAAAGAPDAAAMRAAIEAYFFDPGGGFETFAYTGAAMDAPEADLGEGQRLALAERADSVAVRRLLAGLATLVAGLEAPPGGPGAALALFAAGAEDLAAASGLIRERRALLGVGEAAIAAAGERAEARLAAIDLVRSRLLVRDAAEAAAEFRALETQLASLYEVTARRAGLTLLGFLR